MSFDRNKKEERKKTLAKNCMHPSRRSFLEGREEKRKNRRYLTDRKQHFCYFRPMNVVATLKKSTNSHELLNCPKCDIYKKNVSC